MALRVRELARAAASSKLATSLRTRATLLRYLATGGVVAVIDIGTLDIILSTRVTTIHLATVATVIAYIVSACFHFTINKLFTFRNWERASLAQVRTYLAVSLLCLATTIGIVDGFVHFGWSPLAGKALGIFINIPIGFLGNRYFTFGTPSGDGRPGRENPA